MQHDVHPGQSRHHGQWFCPSVRIPLEYRAVRKTHPSSSSSLPSLVDTPITVRLDRDGATLISPRPFAVNHDMHLDDTTPNKIETFSCHLPSKQSTALLSPIDM